VVSLKLVTSGSWFQSLVILWDLSWTNWRLEGFSWSTSVFLYPLSYLQHSLLDCAQNWCNTPTSNAGTKEPSLTSLLQMTRKDFSGRYRTPIKTLVWMNSWVRRSSRLKAVSTLDVSGQHQDVILELHMAASVPIHCKSQHTPFEFMLC
jgi:hypothetical protein